MFTPIFKGIWIGGKLDKTAVYFGGVKSLERHLIFQQLSYSCGELPFKYLIRYTIIVKKSCLSYNDNLL